MDTTEGDDLTLPDLRFIKQEVTYQLVPFAEDGVYHNCNIKQELPDYIEDVDETSQKINIKQEYFTSEEYLMDEYDSPNQEKDCVEENDNHHSKIPSFTNSTTKPCTVKMKPGFKKKRIIWKTGKTGKNGLTDSKGKAVKSGRHLQEDYFCSNALSVNVDLDETQVNKQEFSCDDVEKEISVSENTSTNNSQKNKNTGASHKGCKNSLPTMLKHSQLQVIPKQYECHICGKGYNHASNRTRHLRTHLHKRHACELCGKSFAHIGALNEHKLYHMIGKQKFPIQNVSFTAVKDIPKSLSANIQSLSNSSAFVQIHEDKVFSKIQKTELPTSKMTTLHMKIPKLSKVKTAIARRKTFLCNICGKSFSWRYLLKRHKQKHLAKHSSKNNNVASKVKYPCVICKKMFSSKAHLIRHESCEAHKVQLNLAHLKDAKTSKYSCDMCNKIYSCSQNLKRHRETLIHKLNVKDKLKETFEKKHFCDMCEKSFDSFQLLRKHEITHFNSRNKDKKMKGILYTCQVCKKSFFWLSEVRKHLISAAHVSNVNCFKKGQNEKDKANHSCNVCGKIFFRQQDLRRHKCNGGHELQECNIVCITCGLKFSRETDLKKHQAMVGHLSDSKKKPHLNFKMVYSCDRCGKTFPWSYQLNNHKISHMPKKYPCKTCGKYFAAEYLLRKHKVLHSKCLTNLSSEKLPHVKVTVCTCNICGEKFAQLNRLRKHKAVCHRLHETVHSENKDSSSAATNFYLDQNKKVSLSVELLEANLLPTAAGVEKKPDATLLHACIMCSKKFSRLRDLHIHRTKTGHITQAPKQENGKTYVNTKSGFSCDVCGKTLSRFSDLSRHKAMAGHNFQICQNPFTKSENTYDIKTQHSLPDSKEHHTLTPLSSNRENENTKTYPCNTCNKKFSRLSDLSRHRNKSGHSFQPEGVVEKALNKGPQGHYSCGTCSKTFKRQNDLRRHIAVTGHAYEALISRKGNSKYFSFNETAVSQDLDTQKPLARNVTAAFNLQESSKAYLCRTCGKTFPWKYQLKNHTCYGPVKKYSCKMCDKHFSQEYLLKRHKLLHTSHSDKLKKGQGAYTCSTCQRVFSRLSDLSRHSNLSGHIGNKTEPKFYCEFCNRFFWRLCDLKRHENKSGHRSYVLNVQEKKLSNFPNVARNVVFQSNNVIKHGSRIGHSSNMSLVKQKANSKNIYQCKVCNRSYSWKSGLNKHRATSGHV